MEQGLLGRRGEAGTQRQGGWEQGAGTRQAGRVAGEATSVNLTLLTFQRDPMRKMDLTVGLGEGLRPADSAHDGLQGDPEVGGPACRDRAAGETRATV